MLRLKRVEHLACALKTTGPELREILAQPSQYFKDVKIEFPGKKPRWVVNPKDPVRRWQKLFHANVLQANLEPSLYSHGGVGGRSILTNARAHIGQQFLFSTDISAFYPSIHHSRVYRLFAGVLECSPDVASACTRLCTHRHHLALGLITSPMLADQLLRAVDTRLGGMCEKLGLIYTRFVDDISISGPFDLSKSGIAGLTARVLEENGFRVNRSKHRFGQLADGISITKITLSEGYPDVEQRYLNRVNYELGVAERLAAGQHDHGPIVMEQQMAGKVNFICWVNPNRAPILMARFKAIDWDKVTEHIMRHAA